MKRKNNNDDYIDNIRPLFSILKTLDRYPIQYTDMLLKRDYIDDGDRIYLLQLIHLNYIYTLKIINDIEIEMELYTTQINSDYINSEPSYFKYHNNINDLYQSIIRSQKIDTIMNNLKK